MSSETDNLQRLNAYSLGVERRVSSINLHDIIDAIRFTLYASADDETAVAVIRRLVGDMVDDQAAEGAVKLVLEAIVDAGAKLQVAEPGR